MPKRRILFLQSGGSVFFVCIDYKEGVVDGKKFPSFFVRERKNHCILVGNAVYYI